MLRSVIPEIQTVLTRSTSTDPNQHLELESRFGNFTETTFVSGVSREQFYRLRSLLSSSRGSDSIVELSTDYISGNIRKSVTQDIVTWIRKDRIRTWDLPDWNIRLTVSRETTISEVTSFNPTTTRIKNRISYYLIDKRGRVDTTIVEMHYSNGKSETIFEVEIEPINPNDVVFLQRSTEHILRLLLDTTILYTVSERTQLINKFNRLTQFRGSLIDNRVLVQARNLKMRDMVWGGLIGNRSTGYTATHKADGTRKLLYIDTSGIWLVMPNEYSLITRDTYADLDQTILDGELIPKSSRLKGAPTAINWFVCFDCLAYKGDIGIQRQPHGGRMNACQIVADVMRTRTDIFVSTKSFLLLQYR